MTSHQDRFYKVIEEDYLNPFNNKLIQRYCVELTITKKWLCFYVKKTYKVHNIKQLQHFGMHKEFLVDFVIFFSNREAAQNFIDDNYHRINSQGIYLGGLSTTSLNVMYDNKTYQKKSDESVEEFYKSLDLEKN